LLHVFSDLIELIERVAFPVEDVFGHRPSEELWFCLVLTEVVVDGGFEVLYINVAALPGAL
jgi:hypothetical protein